jgi:flagellar secretion chaperone FliS
MFSPTLSLAHRPAHAAGLHAYRDMAVDGQVLGADPHRLVSLLFDGYMAALAEARGAMRAGDVLRKGRALGKASRIMEEGLRATLDHKAGGRLAEDLGELYRYVVARLLQAHTRNDETLIDECRRLIEPVQQAWNAIPPTARHRPAA